MKEFETAVIEQLSLGIDRANTDRRARAVVELATLTLLIDAGIVTIEKAAQRILEIQCVLPEPYQAPAVNQKLVQITAWLRSHDKSSRSGWIPEALEGGPDPAPADDPFDPKRRPFANPSPPKG